MASIEIIKKQIYQFLETDTPEVIAIRGAWGVGKTQAWNKYIKDAQAHGRIALDQYSYISLFGVNSLSMLKFSLFEKSINKQMIGKAPGTGMLKGDTLPLFKNITSLLEETSNFSGFSETVSRAIFFQAVNKTVICLDDFERMLINAQEVLGLISELKEQNKCKVALILNNNKLSAEAKEKYDIYREKVFDKEFDFSPTPAESVSFSFENKKPDEYTDMLKEFCCNARIRNIRVIKKIFRFKDDAAPFLKKCEDNIKRKFISSLVLFTRSLYRENDDIPDPNFIKKWNKYESILEDTDIQDNEENDEQKERHNLWKNFLQDYGYSHADGLDMEIASSVERGYYIDANIINEITRLNHNIKYTEAWAVLDNSFDDNVEELIQKMHEATSGYINKISQVNLNASISLLRKLGANEKADNLIELSISSRKDENYFNLTDYALAKHIDDTRMIERFSEVYPNMRVIKPLEEILENIKVNNNWDAQDEEILASHDTNDYYNLFKSIKGENLMIYIRSCLEIGQNLNPSKRQQEITDNVTSALKKIAAENELNKLRVKGLGIKV